MELAMGEKTQPRKTQVDDETKLDFKCQKGGQEPPEYIFFQCWPTMDA